MRILSAIERRRAGSENRLFRLREPLEREAEDFISRQQSSVFSYPEVGATAGEVPSQYNLDHNRISLGQGTAIWNRAVVAIRQWQMFNMPWVRIYPAVIPIQAGMDVVVSVKHFWFYSLNACRIVYIVNEDGPTKRFGFAYGTLEEHAESGEERFTVEWNSADDSVWYDILAFSRPRKILAKLGYPVSRILQNRFATESKVAMLAAVGRG